MRYRIRASADARLDEIARFTRERWGREQAARYLEGLFDAFGEIAARRVPWTPIPVRAGIEGYRRHWRSHVIYWKEDAEGILIVSILHERMDQFTRLAEDIATGSI